jgi:hypothetical protein
MKVFTPEVLVAIVVILNHMMLPTVAWPLLPQVASKNVTFRRLLLGECGAVLRWRHCGTFFQLYSSAVAVNGKKRVVFLGTPEVAAATLRSIYEHSKKGNSPYELVAVITQPPKKQGRSNKLVPSPVAVVAEELGLLAMWPAKVGEGSPKIFNYFDLALTQYIYLPHLAGK